MTVQPAMATNSAHQMACRLRRQAMALGAVVPSGRVIIGSTPLVEVMEGARYSSVIFRPTSIDSYAANTAARGLRSSAPLVVGT